MRNADGVLEQVSWTRAMTAAAEGLAAARDSGGVGVLTGGRLTVTDAYAYAKFARLALRTNDVDFRARVHSPEEEAFLAARVVGTSPESGGVTYTELETAPQVLLVALEPEEESGDPVPAAPQGVPQGRPDRLGGRAGLPRPGQDGRPAADRRARRRGGRAGRARRGRPGRRAGCGRPVR